jgi:hypothetical protein
MKKILKKLIFPVVLVLILIITKYIMWDFNTSTGKRVGNLVKISKKGKIPFLKTWELTLDEGSGEQLTSYLSVKDGAIADELFKFKGRKVVLYYSEHFMGWPRQTKYVVTSWKANEVAVNDEDNYSSSVLEGNSSSQLMASTLSRSLFCSLLGSLKKEDELYKKVKEFVKNDNLYLYKQYKKCND